MILKVGDEYLEFNAQVQIERQAKLFEEISTTDGDYSYSFDIPRTSHNIRLLNIPIPDNDAKTVYQKIDCILLDDNGLEVYKGFIRIEKMNRNVITVSFFSGNNNWFDQISGPLSDIDFSDLDVDLTITNLIAYSQHTEGITFPFVDNGVLVTRSYPYLKSEDFVGAIYVKTVFKRIFQAQQIKIQGELLTDATFNHLVTQKNAKSQAQIDANSTYAQKTNTTARPVELVKYKIDFQNDSVYPYYDGSNDNFDIVNSTWTAPAKMRVRIKATFVPSIVDASYNNRVNIYINGSWSFVDIGLAPGAGGLYNQPTAGDQPVFSLDRTIEVEAGDVIELYSEWQQSLGSTQNDILSGTVEFIPEFIYKIYGNNVIPQWTQAQYVSNILRIFNVVSHYEPYSKTLTFNLFDKIKSKEPIDLSAFIEPDYDVDYVDFISNYGKKNVLSYNEVDLGEIRDYNIENFFKYSQGVIESGNEFLEEKVDIIESDFSNPIGYLNGVFDMSMERLNLVQLSEGDSVDFTAVGADTYAAFTLARPIFLVGDLVRISESSNPSYNGDWVVAATGAGGTLFYGLLFETDATGKATKLIYEYENTDDVFLLFNIPYYNLTKFSGHSSIRVEDSNFGDFAVGYFNLLDTGRQINDEFRQSLSFGEISSPFFYQRTLVDTYWGQFGKVLQDPVKLLPVAHIPYKTFINIDFLRPFNIKSEQSSNMYYLNKITGYECSYKPCLLELIKLP